MAQLPQRLAGADEAFALEVVLAVVELAVAAAALEELGTRAALDDAPPSSTLLSAERVVERR